MAKSLSGTLQDAASANGNGSELDIDGFETLVFQVSSNPLAATVEFEATGTGGTFYPIECEKVDDVSTKVTSTTTAGLFRANCKGIKKIRAPISAYVAGTVTVTANAIQAS